MSESRRGKQTYQPLWQHFQERCVYFTGIQHDACKVGVNYEQIAAPPEDPEQPRFGIAHRLPCFVKDGHTALCAHFRTLTEAEAQAKEREIREDFARFWRDVDAGICPNHHTPITLRQVGRCVYADPCGCRLYQGEVDRKAARR